MKVIFKLPRPLWQVVQDDLSRPHPFAYERVGFLACKPASLSEDGFILLADQYLPVSDDDYEDVRGYGAMMGPGAIRKALQTAYRHNVSMVHVHRHEHHGMPAFSRTDLTENPKFVPDFFKVRPQLPHGAIVLSHDEMAGEYWDPGTGKRANFDQLSIVGRPVWTWWRAA